MELTIYETLQLIAVTSIVAEIISVSILITIIIKLIKNSK